MVVPHKWTRSDVLLTRSPLAIREQAPYAAVRLACVKHATSVQSEPGSNSSVQSLFFSSFDCSKKGSYSFSPEIERFFGLSAFLIECEHLNNLSFRQITITLTLIGSFLVFKELSCCRLGDKEWTRSDVLLTRSPLAIREQAPYAAVRLACVKHATSVQSEPGSNSSVQSLFFSSFDCSKKGSYSFSPEIERFFGLSAFLIECEHLNNLSFRQITITLTLIGSFLVFKELSCCRLGDKDWNINPPYSKLQVLEAIFPFN